MYIKWIVCEVKENLEEEFSIAQGQWIKIQYSEGFIGQVGGFDLNNEKIACVISFWENERSLKLFMENIHDKVFLNNNQSKFCNSIKVGYFTLVLKMEGEFEFLIEALDKGKFLRIADCVVKPEKSAHFEETQKKLWIPEMKNNKGMLGGGFSKDVNNPLRYLVSTFWSSLKNHNEYVRTKLSKLKIKSEVNNDIENINGKQVVLIDSWKIIQK